MNGEMSGEATISFMDCNDFGDLNERDLEMSKEPHQGMDLSEIVEMEPGETVQSQTLASASASPSASASTSASASASTSASTSAWVSASTSAQQDEGEGTSASGSAPHRTPTVPQQNECTFISYPSLNVSDLLQYAYGSKRAEVPNSFKSFEVLLGACEKKYGGRDVLWNFETNKSHRPEVTTYREPCLGESGGKKTTYRTITILNDVEPYSFTPFDIMEKVPSTDE